MSVLKQQIFLIFTLSISLVSGRDGRVINGLDAAVGQFPYNVQLGVSGVTCGASLISNRFILGCAHCVGAWVTWIDANLGVLVWDGPTHQHAPVDEFSYLHRVDMAIFKLKNVIAFNDYIQPVRLTTGSQFFTTFIDQIGAVSGWGGGPSILQYSLMKFVKTGLGNYQNPVLHLTAIGHPEINQKVYPGDSGGPLVVYENGIATQVGIMVLIWGEGEGVGKIDYLSASHVGPQINWIHNMTEIPIRQFTSN